MPSSRKLFESISYLIIIIQRRKKKQKREGLKTKSLVQIPGKPVLKYLPECHWSKVQCVPKTYPRPSYGKGTREHDLH